MKAKEESEKVGLKLNIQKTKIMTSDPITSWQIDGEKWKQWETLCLGVSQITVDGDWSHEIKRCLLLGRKVMTNRDRVWWRTGKPSLLQSMGSQTDMTWQLNSNKSAFNNLWSWIVNDILPCDLIHEFSPSKLSAPRNKNCFISFCFFHA